MISNHSVLSHTSLKHIKSFLSGAFVRAKRQGALDGENPMRDAGVPAGIASKETYAYSLEEVKIMMRLVPEPARTVIATAAFSGLTKSELRGARWEDFVGDELFVSRAVWGRHIGEPKTAARKASVPVIPQLMGALTAHGQRDLRREYIFAAANGAPLNLDNLVTRVIRPALKNSEIKWRGWHAFRRGLATNLHHLGVPDKTIQGILRHANVSTTQKHYILNSSAEAHDAMQQLDAAVANKWQTPAKQYVS
jgi:integrase